MSSQERHTKRTATAVTAAAATIGAVAFALADGEPERSEASDTRARDPFDAMVPPDPPAATSHASAADTVVDTRPSTESPTPTPHVAETVAGETVAAATVAVDRPNSSSVDVTALAPTEPPTTATTDPTGSVTVPTTPEAPPVDDTSASADEPPVTVSTAVIDDPVDATEPTPTVDPLGGHSLTINVDFGPTDVVVVAPTFPTVVSNSPTHGPIGVDMLPSEYTTINVTVQAMPEPEPPAEPEPSTDPVFVPAVVNLGILGDPGPTEPLPPRTPLFDANGPETVVLDQPMFKPGTVLPDGTVVGADGHVPGAPAEPVPEDISDWATTSTYEYVGPDIPYHQSSMAAVMGGNLLLFGSKEQDPTPDDDDR